MKKKQKPKESAATPMAATTIPAIWGFDRVDEDSEVLEAEGATTGGKVEPSEGASCFVDCGLSVVEVEDVEEDECDEVVLEDVVLFLVVLNVLEEDDEEVLVVLLLAEVVDERRLSALVVAEGSSKEATKEVWKFVCAPGILLQRS